MAANRAPARRPRCR